MFWRNHRTAMTLPWIANACHSASGWHLDQEIYSFQHDSTRFPLIGQHRVIDCKMCHVSLDFAQAETSCSSCHSDMHQQTVGDDCARCHHTNSWLVEDVTTVHIQNGFPLQGIHATANCIECHESANVLRFEPIGNECVNCHRADYLATTQPNHAQAGYSTNCTECHNINASEWSSMGFNHDFFPLTGGHRIVECASCHKDNDFNSTTPACISCHQEDFDAAVNPNHVQLDFSTSCAECHTSDADWQPAEFKEHDREFFPVYSGVHTGVWDQCIECHTQLNDFASFTCIECHEHNKPETDNKHEGISGYTFNGTSCLACHPTGDKEATFNHNLTDFSI